MLLRKYDRKTLMRLGMFCLILGALSLRYLARLPGMTPDLADGGAGLFYGLAIGLLILSTRAPAR